jgi:hypothetical protein
MNQVSYYSKAILKQWTTIEKLGGECEMFHATHPEIERWFWRAQECADHQALRVIHEKLNKLIDDMMRTTS